MPTVASILGDYATLSVPEQNAVKSALLRPMVAGGLTMSQFIEKERFSGGRVCPICGCTHIVKNGRRKDGTQRFVCRECGKSFVVATNSIASHTKKSLSVWEAFIDCMLKGLTIRGSATECGISSTTAFFWRQKVLDALQQMADSVKLDGLVEADETFFAVSYKGNHSKRSFRLPRKPHHRGHMTKLRGLSREKVCVPCAVNRTGMSIAKISNLARIKTAGLEGVLSDRIEEGSHIITDKASAYQKFATCHNLELVQLKAGKSSIKAIYNLAHINNYHSELKRFMTNFKGVSTKYLNNYLVWHNFVNYSKESYADKKKILLSFVLSTPITVSCQDISSRQSIPLLA